MFNLRKSKENYQILDFYNVLSTIHILSFSIQNKLWEYLLYFFLCEKSKVSLYIKKGEILVSFEHHKPRMLVSINTKISLNILLILPN